MYWLLLYDITDFLSDVGASRSARIVYSPLQKLHPPTPAPAEKDEDTGTAVSLFSADGIWTGEHLFQAVPSRKVPGVDTTTVTIYAKHVWG